MFEYPFLNFGLLDRIFMSFGASNQILEIIRTFVYVFKSYPVGSHFFLLSYSA